MSAIQNVIFGCAITVASTFAPLGASQAAPFPMPDVQTEGNGALTKVQTFCFGYHCGWERRHYRPRYYYRDHYRPRPYYRPRYERPRYYYGGGRAHVRWCLNRYRTYNPATDRYHAGRGIYRVCYSPYR